MDKQIINPLDKVQPVDGYVRGLLKYASENFGVKIDLDKPTRGQRLEAALAMKNTDSIGFSSAEIMIGRRVSSSENLAMTVNMLLLAEAMSSHPDPRKFYEDFAHQYNPETTNTEKNTNSSKLYLNKKKK
ncbi:MAG: hypothetical protein WCX73_01875 [Candidatus Pacearchaeota archaeon]|jgi:hypothetical protein